MAKKIPKKSTTLRRRSWSMLKFLFGILLLWMAAVIQLREFMPDSALSLVSSVIVFSLGLYLVLGYLLEKGFATEKETRLLRSARSLSKSILSVSFLALALLTFVEVLHI